MRQPVIGAVRGACAGFGLSLASGCDLLIAADNAYFTTAYSWIALSPDGGGTYFLPRIVGMKKAAELLLLAERIDAQQAQELGIVNRVVPEAELEAQVAALAQRLKAGPRHAYGEIKRLLNESQSATLTGQLQSEALAFARCSATRDFQEGIRAFLEKRKPGFSGK
jgi:2-(1,2-epoxy-1,2-dihydrophenyl)acetyl-CoA isomerase